MPADRTPDPVIEIADAMRELQRLRASRKVHAALADATGVELSQQAVQVLLALDGTMTVAQLALAARMDVGAVSRQLRTLEADGCVNKRPSPENASVVLVTTTRRGRATATRIDAIRNDHLVRALADWRPDDREALAVLLHRLVRDLQATPFGDAVTAA